MYDESYGLRFDIYERVHLSDELVGIDQLEEVELTPHIQVLPAGEQVTVRGSLLLSGAYIGTAEDRRSQTLEHWIPVEITLPLNRIRSLEEIRVDIENFDVDLLSTRSLNITGVLSLRGIQVERPGSSTWDPEQFTVVHEADDYSSEPEWLRDYGETARDLGNRSEEHKMNQVDQVQQIQQIEQIEQPQHIQQSDDASPIFTARVESEQQVPSLHDRAELPTHAQTEEEAERLEQEQTLQAPLTADSPKINLLSKLDTTASSSELSSQAETESIADQLLRQPTEDSSASSKIEAKSAVEPARIDNPSASPAGTTLTWAESPWGTPAVLASKQVSRDEEVVDEATSIAVEQREEERTETVEVDVTELGEELAHQEAVVPDIHPESIPDKSSMKVAIGSSKPMTDDNSTIGLSSLIRTNQQLKELEEQSIIEETEQTVPSRDTISDDTRWQSIFLHRVQDDRNFSKVRMCIVQRDDTLDLIASRYQMDSRDIVAHNHLSEPSVAEGQVLYIPLIANV